MITGISHVTFAVAHLERAFRFYVDVIGLKAVARWKEGAYLTAGGIWVALIVDRAASEATNDSSYSHVAFAVSPDDFEAAKARLLTHDAEEWQPNCSYGESFYFLDPDGHKLEIHARDLASRLAWLREHPKPELQWLG